MLLSRSIYWAFGLVAALAVYATLFLNTSLASSSDRMAAMGSGVVCLMLLFGEHYWIPVVGNLLLYAITLFCVFATGVELLGERVARVATLLVTTWPNFIFSAGGASKEILLAALVSATIWLFVRSLRHQTLAMVIGTSALSGLMLGIAS